jgi:TRAP-type C4-dicarboxylate transport system substrate-binding protein
MKIIWGMLKSLEEYQRLAKRFDSKIQELTNGEVSVEIKLFDKDPSDPLKGIENGSLDLYQITTTHLRMLLEEHAWLKCWEVPFLFKNEEHLEKYIGSEYTKQKLKSLETDTILPLTYSYAGGFCGIVSKKNDLNQNYENVKTIPFSNYDYEDMSVEEFMENIYQQLPSNILMYEIQELLKLKPENKFLLNIDVTKHVVVARISMMSKNTLSKIPTQYREVFLSTLVEFLNDERRIIYEKAKNNVEALKKDELIGYNLGLNKEILSIKEHE